MRVGAALVGLVTTGVAGGTNVWLTLLVLLPEPPGAVMRTCSRVMACGGSSSSGDEAKARLAELSPSSEM